MWIENLIGKLNLNNLNQEIAKTGSSIEECFFNILNGILLKEPEGGNFINNLIEGDGEISKKSEAVSNCMQEENINLLLNILQTCKVGDCKKIIETSCKEEIGHEQLEELIDVFVEKIKSIDSEKELSLPEKENMNILLAQLIPLKGYFLDKAQEMILPEERKIIDPTEEEKMVSNLSLTKKREGVPLQTVKDESVLPNIKKVPFESLINSDSNVITEGQAKIENKDALDKDNVFENLYERITKNLRSEEQIKPNTNNKADFNEKNTLDNKIDFTKQNITDNKFAKHKVDEVNVTPFLFNVDDKCIESEKKDLDSDELKNFDVILKEKGIETIDIKRGDIKSSEKITEPKSMESVKQVFEEKIIIKKENNNSITLLMEPKEIGKVKVSLTMENGVIRAEVYPNTEQARNYFKENMDKIMASLGSEGINLGQFTLKDERGNKDNHKGIQREGKGLDSNVITEIKKDVKRSSKTSGLSIYA
ncbi:MAG: flagellar hook-length control protein FliK [Proteobacteria bacterium]|nr:flagellar hook-length control protein FliK [Pseudomonadota bacterium]